MMFYMFGAMQKNDKTAWNPTDRDWWKIAASLTVKSRGKTEIKGKYMKIKRALSFYKHCNSGLIAVKYYHKNTESNRKNCDL